MCRPRSFKIRTIWLASHSPLASALKPRVCEWDGRERDLESEPLLSTTIYSIMHISMLLEKLLSGLTTHTHTYTHTHTSTHRNSWKQDVCGFLFKGHWKGLFPVDEAFGLQPALFSSKLVISFLSERTVESGPGKRRITHTPVKNNLHLDKRRRGGGV